MSDAYQHCTVERQGPILIVAIHRPQVLNAMSPAAHFELQQVFDLYAADPGLQVAILTGSDERAFCVGTDLKELARTGDHRKPPGGFCGITTRVDLFKPVIAAVNGLCLGGGAEVVAACDLAVASERAVFGFPEPRVGLAATGGGALQRLAREMPMKHVMRLLLTGASISAEEARRVGLINEVVPHQELMPAALALAQEILACAPLAVQATKQVVLQSRDAPDFATAMDESRYPAVERMMHSQDAIEGPLAFAQKRKPVWTGT